MKKSLLILVCIFGSSIPMNCAKIKQSVIVDPVQLAFVQKFFPLLLVGAPVNLENACATYMNIAPRKPVMNDVSFGDARRYACHHSNVLSDIFIRYSNEFMSRVYHSYMTAEKAILDIEGNKKLMQTILTGQTHVYTQPELLKITDSFKEAVRNYAKQY